MENRLPRAPVDIVTRLLKSKNKNGCFNIATGCGTSILDICDFFLKKFPNRFRVNYHENLITDVSSSVLCVNKLNNSGSYFLSFLPLIYLLNLLPLGRISQYHL